MEIWIVSFVGGFVGSLLMDITEATMAKFSISSGVTAAYIGRWAKGLANGVFLHKNIADTAPEDNEVRIGQVFHFVVGGGVTALFYPIFLSLIGLRDSSSHLVPRSSMVHSNASIWVGDIWV